MTATPAFDSAEIALDRDVFLRKLIRELSGTLEDVIGLDAAEGYIGLVGAQMGRWIDDAYKTATGAERLDKDQVAAACIDLKRRIQGDFFLISADSEKIVFGNRKCPFAEMVEGRPSLCMMTSNVFGRITADNLGYARVELAETIARGAEGCRVVVWLTPSENLDPDAREYYGEISDPNG